MLRRIFALLAPVALCACPDPNTYGTPRTLAPGDVALQVSASGYGGIASTKVDGAPSPPSVGVRAGVADRVELGARIASFAGLGADAKLNFLRGRVDLAVDPGVQTYYLRKGEQTNRDLGVLQVHVPLLIGINFDPYNTLVLTPGFVATVAGSSAATADATTAQIASATAGAGARLGVGVNFRASDTFSWQPEVTVWHEFNQLDTWIGVVGIGVNIGPQPDYSDLSGEAEH